MESRPRREVATVGILIAFVSACSKGPTDPNGRIPDAPPSATIRSSAQQDTLPFEFLLSWECKNSTSITASWRPVSPPADLRGTDVISPDSAGSQTYSIECSRLGAVSAKASILIDSYLPVVSGKLFGIRGQDDRFEGTRVYLGEEGGVVDSIDVAVDGSFSLPTRQYSASCLRILVDEIDRDNRKFFPSLTRICQANWNGGATFVRIPRMWRHEAGTYVGRVTPLSLELAFTDFPEYLSPPGLNSFFPRQFNLALGAWEYGEAYLLPTPLAFSRRTPSGMLPTNGFLSYREITASDSIRLWQYLSSVNRETGIEYVRPASIEEVVPIPGQQPWGGIELYLERQGNFGGGCLGCQFAYIHLDELGANSSFLVQHELLHALTLGHSAAWVGLMGGAGGHSNTLSEKDIAYLNLLFSAYEVRKNKQVSFWLPEAHQGERVYLLDLPFEPVRTRLP